MDIAGLCGLANRTIPETGVRIISLRQNESLRRTAGVFVPGSVRPDDILIRLHLSEVLRQPQLRKGLVEQFQLDLIPCHSLGITGVADDPIDDLLALLNQHIAHIGIGDPGCVKFNRLDHVEPIFQLTPEGYSGIAVILGFQLIVCRERGTDMPPNAGIGEILVFKNDRVGAVGLEAILVVMTFQPGSIGIVDRPNDRALRDAELDGIEIKGGIVVFESGRQCGSQTTEFCVGQHVTKPVERHRATHQIVLDCAADLKRQHAYQRHVVETGLDTHIGSYNVDLVVWRIGRNVWHIHAIGYQRER